MDNKNTKNTKGTQNCGDKNSQDEKKNETC